MKGKCSGSSVAKPANYNKLEPNGLVKENTYISSNDIIIGKTIPIKKDKDFEKLQQTLGKAIIIKVLI